MPETFTTRTEDQFPQHTIENAAGLRFSVLAHGGVQHLFAGPTMLNLFVGSPLVGSGARVYLRRLADDGKTVAHWIEAVGPASDAQASVGEHGFRWSGDEAGVGYTIELVLHEQRTAWCWRVRLTAEDAGRYDAILAQDVGIASRGQTQNNEAYTSQYLDHRIANHPQLGPTPMARQNLAQHGGSEGGQHPWLIHGVATGGAAALTDAFDFFGPAHRAGGPPKLITQAELPTRHRQSELSYHVLQANAADAAAGGTAEWRFVAGYEEDHPASSADADVSRLDDLVAADAFPALPDQLDPLEDAGLEALHAAPWSGDSLTAADLDLYWPGPRRHEERLDGQLAAFFDDANRHVVLSAKELAVDRRTAHLLMASRERLPGGDTLCSTGYASGPVASHVCFGNPSFNKLVSVSRDPLNLLRGDGARLYARENSGEPWRPLGTASAFAMEPDQSVWVYRLGDDRTVVVTAAAEHEGPALRYTVEVHGPPLDTMLVTHLVLGDREHERAGTVTIEGTEVKMRPAEGSLVRERYPDAAWDLRFAGDALAVGGDELLHTDGERRGLPYVVAQVSAATSWGWTFRGTLGDVAQSHDELKQRVGPTGGASPSVSHADSPEVARLAEALPWFESNAAIHLTCPHGVEQYGGAAWGVRDVCQGPVEWLLARGEHATVARILEDVFAHQYAPAPAPTPGTAPGSAAENSGGGWPQWYMHPPFQNIQSPHSHGDVAVWPIIATVNYLRATGDVSLLERSVPFTQSDPPFEPTTHTATIREHLDLDIQKLREKFVPGTSLLSYGDGDWNDSLQPARPEMRESMVSTWTVELFYQALRGYAEALRQAGDVEAAQGQDATADAVRDDFNRLLVVDDETTGLYLHDADPSKSRFLLHPRDTETGVKHRLLPMIRGIISEVFTPEQAAHHAKLIDNHLLAPDGARLMDHPPHYSGGTMTHFQRLESASFFGREIGLMYVHAHLRYAEAMAKLGRADAFAAALLKVNPVGLEHAVPNAASRQANAYFSSSDAAFLNRADAEKRYDELMHGNVPVNGGWRVYSSGPGIYLGLIVRQWLGLRRDYGRFVIDPVLAPRYDGLTARLTVAGKDCHVTYRVSGDADAAQSVTLDGQALEPAGREANPYRTGGLSFDYDGFAERLHASAGRLEVRS